MSRQFTFRLTSEGVEKLKRDLEALGAEGKKVFDNLAAAAPRLSDPLNKASESVARARAGLSQFTKISQEGQVGLKAFGSVVRSAGFEFSNFALSIASGEGAIKAATKQAGSLLAMFGGPWGAAIGAAATVAGTLAAGYFKFASAAEKAAEQQDALNKKLEKATELMEKLNGPRGDPARATLEAERRNQIGAAEFALAQAQAQLARTPRFVGGKGGATESSEFLTASAEVKRLQKELTELAATLGQFDDGLEQLGQQGADAYKDISKAQDKVLKGLDEELRQAKATARERFILQAIARDTAKLEGATADQIKAVSAEIRAKAGAIYDETEAQKQATQAQQDATRESERQKKASEDATAALEAQLAGLSDERAQLKLTERERVVHNELLKAEAQIRKGIVKDADAYRATIAAEAGILFDENAVKDARAKALEDQKRETERAGKERDKELEREADRQAKLLQAPFLNAAEGIQDVFADTFTKIFNREIVRFSDLASAIRGIFAPLAGEVATLFALKPVAGGILNSIGLNEIAGKMGFAQSPGGLGSGSSGFGGGTGLPGGMGNLGSLFFGSPTRLAAGGSGPSSVVGSTSGLFGSGGGGQVGAFLNTPFGGGLAGAGLGFLGSLATGGGLLSSGITGAGTGIGAAIGSIFGAGPIGGAVGGLLGSLIGGLFGKKDKTKTQRSKSWGFVESGASGLFDFERLFVNKRGDPAAARQFANSAEEAINALALETGARFDPGIRGMLGFYSKVKSKGGKEKSRTEYYQAQVDLAADPKNKGLIDLGRVKTEEEAAALLASGTLAAAVRAGKVEGVSESVGKIFLNVAKRNKKESGLFGVTDQAEIAKMVAFGRFFDRTDTIRTGADAAAEALRNLDTQMRAATDSAEEYGLEVGKIDDIFRDNFADDIKDELLALTDPQKFALDQIDKEYAARKAVAEQLGVDLVDLEKLYALKRQQIVDEGLQGIASTWQDFINALQFGATSALSPADQLENARKQYEASKSAGGQSFRDSATTYLALQKDAFGSTQAYADLFAEVIAMAKQLGNLQGIPGFASGGDHAGGWMKVGERGPELLATGAARVFNASDTSEILRRLSAPRQGNAENWIAGSQDNASDGGRAGGSAAIAGHLASFSGAIERLVMAQENSNREQRLTRELLRAK